jgi:hypothetical protein
MRKTKAKNMHAGKTLGWAGATPRLCGQSRPKFCGVTPARHRGTVIVFCPRAYTDVSEPKCGEAMTSNKEGRKSRWQC